MHRKDWACCIRARPSEGSFQLYLGTYSVESRWFWFTIHTNLPQKVSDWPYLNLALLLALRNFSMMLGCSRGSLLCDGPLAHGLVWNVIGHGVVIASEYTFWCVWMRKFFHSLGFVGWERRKRGKWHGHILQLIWKSQIDKSNESRYMELLICDNNCHHSCKWEPAILIYLTDIWACMWTRHLDRCFI